MTPGAKMLLMARTDDKRRYPDMNYPRMDYPDMNYPRMDYAPYSTYPEKDWDTANYGDTEARFRDRRGREHYDNGRYAPKAEYPYTPLVPPVYRGDVMNRIGFAAESEIKRDYRTDISNPHMDETGYHTSEMAMGHAKGGEMVLTEEMADEWMHGLHNEDGTKGPHWTKEQVKQVMAQKGIKADSIHFWAAMNASYSDLCAIAKKHGVNTVDFYTDYSVAFWLQDKDAVEDKLCAYFLNVVK